MCQLGINLSTRCHQNQSSNTASDHNTFASWRQQDSYPKRRMGMHKDSIQRWWNKGVFQWIGSLVRQNFPSLLPHERSVIDTEAFSILSSMIRAFLVSFRPPPPVTTLRLIVCDHDW